MFAVVLGCVLCNLSTAAYLSEREQKRLKVVSPLRTSAWPEPAAERREAPIGKGTQPQQAESGIHIYNYIIYLKEKAYSCVFFEKIITFENSISAFCPENGYF